MLIDADATDPMAGVQLAGRRKPRDRTGADARPRSVRCESLSGRAEAVELVLHRRYNPEGKARLNIVPGLLAVILSMTMVLMTALAVTRERELGTMENLLATPARPIEVMIGKIVPYFVIGLIQTGVILVLSWLLFDIAVEGSMALLLLGTALFIIVNLAIGFTLSTLAQNQLQAMQSAFFILLPSILLSGFMFPFRGMPVWAQWLGEMLPATHFIRIARGVMLKGADLRRHRRRTGGSRHHPHRRVGAGDQPLPHHPGRRCETGGLTAARARGQARSPCPRPPSTRPTRSPA